VGARILIALAITFSFAQSYAKLTEDDLDIECQGLFSVKKWSYCITKTKGSTNPDVIFHLHQAGGNEHHWIEKWQETRNIWRAQGFQPPTVISVGFGPIWFLAEKNSSSVSGLFGYFIETVMPEMEKLIGGVRGKRMLFGESMGGFNAMQLYFKRPDLFTRIAAVCPAITTVGPQSTQAEVDAYIARNKASKFKVDWHMRGLRQFFPDKAAWDKANPFALLQNFGAPWNAPELFMSCGTEDSWGFYEGASQLALELVKRSQSTVTWHSMKGDHCARPQDKVAEFFSH
jgi:pimeloyl-ACP methyl ester carboxylesterase